jgi:hypothetical protein
VTYIVSGAGKSTATFPTGDGRTASVLDGIVTSLK